MTIGLTITYFFHNVPLLIDMNHFFDFKLELLRVIYRLIIVVR